MSFSVKWAVCTALLVGSAQADTIGEESRMKINRISATDFEVLRGPDMGPSEFWCGAGSYVIRRQGLPSSTVVYLKRGIGPSVAGQGSKSVVFSTSATGLTPRTSSVWSTRDIGTAFKSSQALRLCRDAFTRSTK